MRKFERNRQALPHLSLSQQYANGQGLSEFIIMVILVGIIVLVAVRRFGGSVKCEFNSASQSIDAPTVNSEGCQTSSTENSEETDSPPADPDEPQQPPEPAPPPPTLTPTATLTPTPTPTPKVCYGTAVFPARCQWSPANYCFLPSGGGYFVPECTPSCVLKAPGTSINSSCSQMTNVLECIFSPPVCFSIKYSDSSPCVKAGLNCP